MQRLNDTDIFLKPDGTGSRICRLTREGIIEGGRASIAAHNAISLTCDGWVAAITGKGRRVWTARINRDLRATSVGSNPLPMGVHAHSLTLAGHRLFVGGTYDQETWLGVADIRQVMDSDDAPEFRTLAQPDFLDPLRKPIDDLLVNGSRLLAIDDFVWPKWLLVYDLNRGERPALVHHELIDHHHTYEHVLHGAVGGGWLLLLSTSRGRAGSYRHLAIYHAASFRELAVVHVEVEQERARSVQTTGFHIEAPDRLQSRQRSAEDILPPGFVPSQVVCVDSRFYIRSTRGQVVSLALGSRTPRQVSELVGLRDWFRDESLTGLFDRSATTLVAVPSRGRVVAANDEGETAILGGERTS